MTKNEDKYKGYILVVREKPSEQSDNSNQDLISIPMIFDQEMLSKDDFDFADYIEDNHELVFIQTYEMMTHQLLALRKLAKKSGIELTLN